MKMITISQKKIEARGLETREIEPREPDVSWLKQVAEVEAVLYQAQAWSIESLTTLLSSKYNYLLLVLNDNHQPIAYCVYQAMFESAEILRIGTHPNWQRQGIALGMLQKLIATLKADKVESLLLEVRANNTSAIRLYHKLGFIQIDCRKGYYKVNNHLRIDAMIMQLQL